MLRRIWHVTIPQTRLILSLMFLLQVVATMQVFIEPLILAGGNGVAGLRHQPGLPHVQARVPPATTSTARPRSA